MKLKIGINGMGRIGRMIVRSIIENNYSNIEIKHKNKEKALAVLRSRLLAQEIEKQQQEITDSRRSMVGSGDRSERVRTYNFPQGRITDHRINLTSYNLEQVLDGDLLEFIEALVQEEQAYKLENSGL